ncbi:hypothetical protein D3C81_2199330 [compost metagenome]
MIAKYSRTGLALRRFLQIAAKAIAVENIVAKYQSDIATTDKFFPNNKCLG